MPTLKYESTIRSTEPTKKVAEAHQRERDLKNRIHELETQLRRLQEHNQILDKAVNLAKMPPRDAIVSIAAVSVREASLIKRVREIGALADWLLAVEDIEAAETRHLAAGKAVSHA